MSDEGTRQEDTETRGEPGGHVLERDRRLSESLLWRAQRRYFEDAGVTAWSTTTVPHYVITNPALAHAMARVVFAFLDEPGDAGEPHHIVELGAGCGRFGYLFLKALLDIRAHSARPDLPIRYVMTDFVESNVAFWRGHPSLRPFVDAGLLDFARFDLEEDRELSLLESGARLVPGGLGRPLVVIANYVFDGVPQDAFTCAGGQLHEALITVSADQPGIDPASSGSFAGLHVDYRRRPVSAPYGEPVFDDILGDYARTLSDTTVLFPTAGLRCVERLAALAGGQLLLLTGDKGHVRLAELEGRGDPEMAMHGSFSVPVNYHAFCEWFRRQGGEALLTGHRQLTLQVVAFMLGAPPGRAAAARLAYHLAFDAGSSDDLFRLRQGIQEHLHLLDFEHLLSLVRLSRHDPRILRACMRVLHGLVDQLSASQVADLVDTVRRVWGNYFHIGEEHDLAFDIAALLHAGGDHVAALDFYRASLRLHGDRAATYWNIGLCLFSLGRPAEAKDALARAWETSPGFTPAPLGPGALVRTSGGGASQTSGAPYDPFGNGQSTNRA